MQIIDGRNLMKRTSFQFELWEECNSKCTFCYLGKNNKKTDDQYKIQNIEDALKQISNPSFIQKFNCIGYIGGEFFQGQLSNIKVKDAFMKLMSFTAMLLKTKKIEAVWISASLLIGNQNDLFNTLKLFDDLSKVWVLTSYDTFGRFHSLQELNTWKNNLDRLKSSFPSLQLNITSIVTGDFIRKYLARELELYAIAKQYHCAVFLKPPCLLDGLKTKNEMNDILGYFFPFRSDVLKFLIAYKHEFSSEMYDKLFNMKYRAEYLQLYGHRQKFSHRIASAHQEYSSGTVNDITYIPTNSILLCGHSSQYQCYIDSDQCIICDKDMINKMYG